MFFALLFLSSLSHASPLVVYGEDNRHDVFTSRNAVIKSAALSTAALIENANFKVTGSTASITGRLLGEMYYLCPEEKFRYQPVAANCSGTLVAPDIIMTASHCYDLEKEICRNNSWVFDYRVSKDRQPVVTVPSSSVYKCKEVLHNEIDLNRGLDFALIRLDRPVSGRSPVRLQAASVKEKDEVVLIGHPSGLPTKIADGGYVLKILENSFVTNLDAFSVNSGSGVFHPRTGEVLGILSSGKKDYESQNGCTVPSTLKMEEGREVVINLKKVSEVLKRLN